MKKIVGFLLCLFMLAGCSGNKYELTLVENKDSITPNNYVVEKEFSTLVVKTYDLQKKKWTLVDSKEYTSDEVKGQIGVAGDNVNQIQLYLGNYNQDSEPMNYTYMTQMESYAEGKFAGRQTLYAKSGQETPFVAYWAFKKDTKYEVGTKETTLNRKFLENKNEADGGFLITLTFNE